MRKPRTIRFKNLPVDMTAMCDVALLVLCFFIVTSRFEQWEPLKIYPPSTTYPNYRDAYPNENCAIIYLKGDKALFQMQGDRMRKLALSAMTSKYGVTFSQKDTAEFLKSPITAAPMAQLKQYDAQYANREIPVNRPGIPYNSDTSELFDWVKQARIADKILNNKALLIVIKADKDVKYASIRAIITLLRKQKFVEF